MAGEIPPLVIQAVLNPEGVTAGVAKVKTELAGASVAAEETGAKFSSMGKSMVGAFAGMAAIAGAVALLKGSVKAAEEMQVATAQLSTSMNNARLNTEANRIAVEKSTLSMQNLGFKSAETETAFSKLIAATHSVSESTRLMSAAADLARFKHESLSEAAVTLARGTTGSARAFREFGIVLDSHIPKNQAIAKAFDELNKKIGGDAASYATTFAGKMQIMGANMESVKETIGGALIPILSDLMNIFTRVLGVIKPILPELTFLVVAIAGIVAVVKLWSLAQAALNFVLDANPIMLVVAGVALLTGAFVVAWNHSLAFRKIVIEVMKAIVEAVGWVIGAIGELVVAFIKFETGPLHLILKGLSYLPGVGGAAKSALKEIGSVTNDIGKFFDSAKSKVDSFANGLDSLATTKITFGSSAKAKDLSNAGGMSNGQDLGIQGLVPGGGVSKGAAKAAASAAKHIALVQKNQDALKKLYEQEATILKDRQSKMDAATQARSDADDRVKKSNDATVANLTRVNSETLASIQQTYDDSDTAARDAHLDALKMHRSNYLQKKEDIERVYLETLASIQQTYDDSRVSALDSHQDALKKLDANYNQKRIDLFNTYSDKIAQINLTATDKTVALEQSASDKRKSIIQQSIDALTNVWASATKLDVGSLFKASPSVGALVSGMKDQLAAIIKLQKDAGDLAAAGYSQSFIQQVLAQGPKIGDQMAQSILKSSPATQSQIKDLYGQIQNTSATGLDALATQMNDGTKFVTESMADAYAQVGVTLRKSLADNQSLLATDLAKENSLYTQSLADAARIYRDAVVANDVVLSDSLATATRKQTEAQAKALQTFTNASDSAAKAYLASVAASDLTLSDALAKAALKQTEAQAKANQSLKDGMATAASTLADSLTSNQTAFDKAIKALSDSTMKQLDNLQAKIAVTASKLASLGSVAPSNPNAIPMTGLTGYVPSTGVGSGVNTSTLAGITAASSTPKVPVPVPTTAPIVNLMINGTNLSSPSQTASTIINHLKYNNIIQ
jgi:hypothetical protein